MFNFFKKKIKLSDDWITCTTMVAELQKAHAARVAAGIPNIWRHKGNGDLYTQTFHETYFSKWVLFDSTTLEVTPNTKFRFKDEVYRTAERRSSYEAMV